MTITIYADMLTGVVRTTESVAEVSVPEQAADVSSEDRRIHVNAHRGFTIVVDGRRSQVDVPVVAFTGPPGDAGWSPILAAVADGDRLVLQLVGWTGGEGDPPASGSYIGLTGLVPDIADAVNIRGTPGTDGVDGNDGWTPILAVVSDGERRVLQVVGWAGGEGSPPASGLYVGATGLVVDIADGIDVRGAQGIPGVGLQEVFIDTGSGLPAIAYPAVGFQQAAGYPGLYDMRVNA